MKSRLISSRDNPLYKELKQLASSGQARRKSGRTVLDGIHLCEAYLQFKGMPLVCVAAESSMKNAETGRIVAACEEGSTQCILLPDVLYQSLSQVENGVGLAFVIETPIVHGPRELKRSAVLLDRLQDPGNLGSILRSAAAAGVTDVFCAPGTVHAWSPKVLRAGMGAHFLLRIMEDVDLAALIETSSVPVMATSSHASKSIYDADLGGDVAWLFGHEGQGADEALLARATHRVSIPHLGAVESLNVAASAAVCLFEQVRQKKLNTSSSRT